MFLSCVPGVRGGTRLNVPRPLPPFFYDHCVSSVQVSRGVGDMIRSTAPLPSALINLRLVEEVLYDLPPLEGVFLHWHTYGVKATTAGIDSLFIRRKQLLGSTTLPGTSIQLLSACATDCLRSLPIQEPHSPWDIRPLHARLLRHGPRLRAVETQALLPPGVLVQQTLSISLADTPLLCTTVGPQMLTRR